MSRLPETTEILEALVGFDSTSRNSNLAIVGWIEAYLDRLGVTHERIPDKSGAKANLWATIGPAGRPGYILSGHTDVVPVDGQTWSNDPFRLTARGGRLHGRGATDMKGYLACCLAAVPEMVAGPLATPIHLSFSHDEEIGCVGVRTLIAHLGAAGIKPAACFVGEPTSMNVVVGHKGKRSFRVEVRGRTCHSSLAPQGVNAVEYAARLIVKIREMADRLAREGARDPLYDVPYTTIHTGVVAGGTALNIVPDACSFQFEFRPIAADDLDALTGEVKAYARERLEPEMQRGGAGGGVHLRGDVGLSRARHGARGRRGRARQDAGGTQRAQQGRLRHRGRAVRAGRHPDRGDRPRLDRAGAQGR